MLFSSLLLVQPDKLDRTGMKYLHNHSAVIYRMQQEQQIEVEVSCLMTIKDMNLLEGLDEQTRLDWLI
ncbi:MAG: hypothetical protein JWQ38_604 [Flavipsychrobacter sp.]|jgi:hypothetical protein|nr:hypothetical protein [Flavipsychrobacter sp.]